MITIEAVDAVLRRGETDGWDIKNYILRGEMP
jgi:hypothetical protein